jgi:Ca2+-binding EF-hand superfamily protein
MLTRKLAFAAIALTLTSTLACAAPGGGPKLPPEYDLDGDGTITEAEVQAARTAEFQQIDADDDGYASLEEMQAWTDQKVAGRFNSLDEDQNGALSQDEFVDGRTGKAAKRAAKDFRLADKNKDSALSLDEFKGLAPSSGQLIRHFARMDTDDDDRVSEAEYLAKPKAPNQGGGQQGQGGERPGPRH